MIVLRKGNKDPREKLQEKSKYRRGENEDGEFRPYRVRKQFKHKRDKHEQNELIKNNHLLTMAEQIKELTSIVKELKKRN